MTRTTSNASTALFGLDENDSVLLFDKALIPWEDVLVYRDLRRAQHLSRLDEQPTALAEERLAALAPYMDQNNFSVWMSGMSADEIQIAHRNATGS